MEENNKKSFREKLLGFKQKAENDLEQERIEKQNKIKFHKKVWFSITKLSKYQEMAEEGFKTATKYLVGIIAFFSIFLSLISSYEMNKNTKDGIEYIKENLPEITYSEGILKSDATEKVTLKHSLVKEITNGILIIDTNVESEEVINQYIDEIGKAQKAVILLKNKVITVNWGSSEKTQEYNYQDLLKQYALQTKTEEMTKVTKYDIVNYIENKTFSFTNYIIQYFVSYVIIYFGNFIIYIGVVCLIAYLTNKILKLGFKLKEMYSMTVYAFTLPIISYMVYTITFYFTQFMIPYFLELFMMVAYIYLVIVLLKIKHSGEIKEGEN